MNIFDLNDLDESHATSQDLDEHARNRCDAQWFFCSNLLLRTQVFVHSV